MFAFAIWQLIISGVAFGISFAIVDNPMRGFNLGAFGWFGLSALCAVAGITTWVMGIKSVPVSIAQPFSQSSMLFLLALSWLIFRDTVGWAEILLVVIIFVSCVAMGYLQFRSEPCNVGKRAQILVVLGAITLLILGISLRTSVKSTFTCKNLVGIGITDGSGAFFFFPLAAAMNLGVLDAIQVISTMIIIFAGVVFLKERVRWYKYPFIGAIVVCSILLGLLSGGVI